MGKTVHLVSGITISLLCLYLACRGVDLRAALSTFSTLHFLYLAPVTIVLLAAFVVRALRWRYLLLSVKVLPVHSLFASTMVGFMANNILPFRAGELVRAYSLARSEQVSVTSAVATLIVERLLDGLVISMFMVVLLFSFPLPDWLVKINDFLLILYGGALVAGGGAVWLGRRTNGIDFLSTYVPVWGRERFRQIAENFTAGLQSFHNGKQILWISILSLSHWLLIGGYYYLLFQACDLQLSFSAALVVLVVITLGIMLPTAPGFVGTFQYFTVFALSLFSIPKDEALGFSFVAHAAQFIPVTLVGLIYVMRQSFTFSELTVQQPQRV
jgi:uncharacterized protein (TIRG00374 family)